MATVAQIEAGAVKYIDAELAPKIPENIPNGQLKKIAAVAGAVYAIKNGLRKAIASPALSAIGAIDESGNIDVDGLIQTASAQIPSNGFKVTVPILGDLTFFPEDLEKLAEYIKKES